MAAAGRRLYHLHMRERIGILAVPTMFMLLASLLAAGTGCEGEGPRVPERGEAFPSYSFRGIATSLEVKKAVADPRGVLWLLDFSGRMHTLDPEMFLAPLQEAGEGIVDFCPLRPSGAGEEAGMPAGVYLARGNRGLQRLDSDGVLNAVAEGNDVFSVGDAGGGRLWAGTSRGFLEISPQEVKSESFDGGVEALLSMAYGPRGERLGVVWENRVMLFEESAAGGGLKARELDVPGEVSVRVVALLGGMAAGPWLVTTQALYRPESGGLIEVARWDDPVTSACSYGGEGILLGRSSGRLALWREGMAEEEIADLGSAVDRLAFSNCGLIYAVCGREIYRGEPPAASGEPVARSFSLRLHRDDGNGGLALSLPESPSLDPRWYYLKVKSDARELSWEVSGPSDFGRELHLEGAVGDLAVEALVVAERARAWKYEPGDALTFPAVFPEEGRPYLERSPDLPWDLEGLQDAVATVPAELREDMLSALTFLVKRSAFFYRAPASPSCSLPPEPGSGLALEYARASLRRAIDCAGGDDYGRSLLLVMLCRELGIPARQSLCFNRYLAQVYLYGVGWVAVDVSAPVFDLESGTYPAIGSLPSGTESLITATGAAGDALRFLRYRGGHTEEAPYCSVDGGDGGGFASALVVCRPAEGSPPAEGQSLKLPEGGWFYFQREPHGVRFVRQGPHRRDILVLEDERAFPLGLHTSADVFIRGGLVVLKGPPTL